ncbi:unnamed protein product [Ambrosiozyma monospora]|uniref:Unnamed protein product n=1 Tax=Ambrosiozyma monospora TaxID=43982 RepID=A0A9W6YYL0_AMBMO|nr:unnamed protein product [Ambrosiozyma monospora]
MSSITDSINQVNKKDEFDVESRHLTFPTSAAQTEPEDSHLIHGTVLQLDKVYRHLDYRIIPALWFMYFMGSFGGSAYGNTFTMNFESGHSLIDSLHLTSHDTSTASALDFVGYIIFDVPMNLIMTKLSPQIWLSRILITVGLMNTCFAALKNAKGLMALRFLGGVCGAGTWPGMSYYISLWYPSDRSAKRIGYYFTAAQFSASAAGLVAAGFQKIDMVHGYEGWRWMYIVYGVFTMSVGISLVWWLPDRPAHLIDMNNYKSTLDRILPAKYTKWLKSPQPLNEEEREWHAADMHGRYKDLTWKWMDIANILTDVRTWPLIMMYFGVVGTGFGLAVFGTTLIEANNPNLSGIDVSLLYAPIWMFDAAAILLITPLADKYKKWRPVFFISSTIIIIVGLLVTTYAHGHWNRYAGLLIAGFGLGPTVPIIMTTTNEIMFKRYGDIGCACASALVSGLGNLGSVVGTYALYSGWPADADRLYQYSNMMLVLMLGFSIVSCIVLVLIRWGLGDFKEGHIHNEHD